MLAFNLNGNDEYITLYINKVLGFPNETTYGGGYGAQGDLSIKVGNYIVNSSHWFTTGELYDFYKQIKLCYETLQGKACLINTEYKLELNLSLDKFGHVLVDGSFQERMDIRTKLTFEMVTDQTQLIPVIEQLSKVVSIFGDKKGSLA